MQRGTETMIQKILLFFCLMCITLPSHAQTDVFCISSEKLTEMHNQMPSLNPDMQQAYTNLFEILLNQNESDTTNNAGCISQQDLAQICKNVWGDNTEMCETFIYIIMTSPQQTNLKILNYSPELSQVNFDDINPDIFNQAVNKCAARGRNQHIPSKLQNMGTVFLDQAKEKHINPFIFAAISLYESNRGRSGLAINNNNIGGLRNSKGWMKFDSVPDSIATQAKTLQNKVLSGKTTLSILSSSGSYNQTNRSQWFNHVSSIAKELYRNYNEIIQKNKNR